MPGSHEFQVFLLRFAAAVAVAFALTVLDRIASRKYALPAGKVFRSGLGFVAAGWIGLSVVLVLNLANFPLHLEVLEGVVLQHFQRALAHQPIYVEPTAAYVPLSYNPLYYYLSIPLGRLVGGNLLALRLTSIAACALIAGVLFAVVRGRAQSVWWAWIALGLFAAVYGYSGAHLGAAHADACLIASAMLGFYVLSRARRVPAELAGIALLCASFWIKQHGAWFALAGVSCIAARRGLRAWPHFALATLLGPVAFLTIGPRLFGPEFIDYTFREPMRWTEFSMAAFARVGGYFAQNSPLLFGLGIAWTVRELFFRQTKPGIWPFGFAAAVATAVMGALDPGSADNVFYPLLVFCILEGVVALSEIVRRCENRPVGWRYALLASLMLSFALRAYNPANLYRNPGSAARAYTDFVSELDDLDGPVYAPWQAYLGEEVALSPRGHWIAIEDLIRHPKPASPANPVLLNLLEPALHANGRAYIVTNLRLQIFPWLSSLDESYELKEDFGARFKPLATMPNRYPQRWPRYLYERIPQEAAGS